MAFPVPLTIKIWKALCCVVNKIRIRIDKKDIVACHRLGRTDRTIVKFLNRNDAEAVFAKKRRS